MTLSPLPPVPVSLLTDGECAWLRAWAEDYSAAAVAPLQAEIERLRSAQQPTLYSCNKCGYMGTLIVHPHCDYNATPPQQRQPLKHMQIVLLWGHRSDGPDTSEIVSFARAIEQAHGIKETT